ncbi:MAG: osmoprotectant NAGGN system M42 family peptidase [Myxococcota bacterium]
MKQPKIDKAYLQTILLELLNIPSPSGYTDAIVHYTCERLHDLGIRFELTRRGAIRADLTGRLSSPDRAIVSHVDTIGGMVKNLKDNGRLAMVPVGYWSSRFAEGGRVTVFAESGPIRGTVLPLKASGHTFNQEIDTQPVSWSNVEIRVDRAVETRDDLIREGIAIGDFVAFDPNPEVDDSCGFINSRHLDCKAGVASMLAAAKAVLDIDCDLPLDCHLLFTISEEVGSGASSVLHGDVAEMLAIDNATPAPGQASREFGVTIAMADSTGPFDYHFVRRLVALCREYDLPYQRDVFRYYRTDAASAIEAGNDIRTALVCFGADASHGYERTHMDALETLARLITLYVQTPLVVERDRERMGPIEGFPTQPTNPPPGSAIHWPPKKK